MTQRRVEPNVVFNSIEWYRLWNVFGFNCMRLRFSRSHMRSKVPKHEIVCHCDSARPNINWCACVCDHCYVEVYWIWPCISCAIDICSTTTHAIVLSHPVPMCMCWFTLICAHTPFTQFMLFQFFSSLNHGEVAFFPQYRLVFPTFSAFLESIAFVLLFHQHYYFLFSKTVNICNHN